MIMSALEARGPEDHDAPNAGLLDDLLCRHPAFTHRADGHIPVALGEAAA